MADFATSGGHWYRLDGTPAYTMTGANGAERNVTLRDARKLQLVPSVTTIIRMAAAPGLEKWKRDNPDWEELGRIAADRGTAIHGAIERFFRGEYVDPELTGHCLIVSRTLAEKCGEQHWLPERSFAHPLGYGGKNDLYSEGWVIDYKSKDGIEGSKLWDNHLMQLAAYRRGLGVYKARCGILFVERAHASALLVEASESDLERGLGMFDGLLAYWQAMTGYRPCQPT